MSKLAGHAALVLAAATACLLHAALGGPDPAAFLDGDALRHTQEPGDLVLAVAAAGALARVAIRAACRRGGIAGPPVAMRLIEAGAATGVALGLGRPDLALDGLGRLLLDMGFALAAGLVVFGGKQLLVRRRDPLR